MGEQSSQAVDLGPFINDLQQRLAHHRASYERHYGSAAVLKEKLAEAEAARDEAAVLTNEITRQLQFLGALASPAGATAAQ